MVEVVLVGFEGAAQAFHLDLVEIQRTLPAENPQARVYFIVLLEFLKEPPRQAVPDVDASFQQTLLAGGVQLLREVPTGAVDRCSEK